MIAEIIGYIASLLLAVSLVINNDIKFRWLNSMGCMAFIIYGILINALPIIITNSILMIINCIHLIRIYQKDENFALIEFSADDKFINEFIDYNKLDIRKFFPDFVSGLLSNNTVSFAVLRDMVIANIFIAALDRNGKASVLVNYTIPKFRDFKVGRYLFKQRINYFRGKGIKEIVYTDVANADHEHFLKIIGFSKSVSPEYKYQLTIDR